MKRALVLRHVDYEGIAGYREPIEAAGYVIDRVAAHHAGCARLDILAPDLLVVMGANPAASQGSLMAAPDVMGIIYGIRQRGRVIVIDPVRTATAARADEWLPITPGTDAALLLAVAHTLFDENLVDLGDLEPHIDGLDRMRAVAADWSPDRVAAVTNIDGVCAVFWDPGFGESLEPGQGTFLPFAKAGDTLGEMAQVAKHTAVRTDALQWLREIPQRI